MQSLVSGRRRVAWIVTTLSVGVVVLFPTGVSAASRIPPPPYGGVYLGAFVDPDSNWSGLLKQEGEIRTFEQHLGRRLDIDHHYYGWSGSSQTFPAAIGRWDVSNGRIPMISWEGTHLVAISSGQYDSLIRSRAKSVKNFGHRVFIRWGYEMNGNWNSWDGTHNNSSGYHDGPAKYVAAWRHIHNIFDNVGATNVSWVWCPNDRDVPSASWNHWTNYYPGDAYVDWVCIDGYNWGTTQSWSSWTPFASLYNGVYRTYAGRKPIMIGEVASAERGGDKAQWIRGMWTSLVYHYPAIHAIVWTERGDWKVETSSAATAAFRHMAQSPFFTQHRDTDSPHLTNLRVSVTSTRSILLKFSLSEPARVTISVRNQLGKVVRTLGGRAQTPGARALRWNFRNSTGGRVKAGIYRWTIKAWDRSGNVRYARSQVYVK
jgi:FlgD Ig-like domain/Glycosyl hydrolase family 26